MLCEVYFNWWYLKVQRIFKVLTEFYELAINLSVLEIVVNILDNHMTNVDQEALYIQYTPTENSA